MKEQKKKRLIVGLLFISCFISGYILLNTSETDTNTLQSLAQADTLIQNRLANFNISDSQVAIATTEVDSNFVRKTYHVGVPYGFSKTQFHAELNRLMHPYGVNTPARVSFPAQDINIQLTYKDAVIRTISLQTDPELSLQKNNISMLMAFDELPADQTLSDLASLGEPIPLVIKIEQPMEVQDLREKLNGRYTPIIFWMQNQNGKDLIKTNPDAAAERLNRLQDISPNANILALQDKENISKLGSFSKITFINASNALLLHEEIGKESLFDELQTLQSNTKQFSALITGNENTVSWVKEKLPDLKKAGVNIVIPPKIDPQHD